VATIISKCEIAGKPTSPEKWTCSQDIFIIRASDREMAYEKALNLGRSQEHSYLNDDRQMVVWTYVGLENLEQLSVRAMRDGTDVWGRIFHSNDPEALVVGREGLSVFYNEEIKDLTAAEIMRDGPGTKLVCNRIRSR
jgi:hypothetical protein